MCGVTGWFGTQLTYSKSLMKLLLDADVTGPQNIHTRVLTETKKPFFWVSQALLSDIGLFIRH
ncbi:hypothetical protein THICB1_30336 [Thiomonas arsenitoxydans]|uniref:Glutamine amidotransferase type-2 domain-containing protein n=1 Tax=Thiomonas arsenitoxydans (strain DSM 22701 / CIP 110005 / 3As) TaxID=426114 RepID=A0ABM9T5X7_THIA3|nr:hypothetical protein THICB6_150067 [Thiomonas arsenitoxydans]CQR32514.1 hypothetical protein ACO7_330002 [Thiomonas arsenitoxydans]CQR32859.1 hypothetical protein ACO3_350002 [Thiomonas arsenitoxydans]CQR34150.1 hypothetical protein THICB1_30336 [Thiomonas arsenitoxydans]CQR40431.1 hypothetical protein THICB6_80337 [Thiomonas arsenitoxydans]